MIIQLIILQVAALAVIIFVLRQVFARHVSSALSNLQGLYQDNLKREEVLNEEIARIKALREQEIVKAKEEARRILSDAKEKAEADAQRIVADAESKAQAGAKQILDKAHLQLDNEYRQMVKSLQDKIAGFSESAISYILSQKSKRLLQEQLTEELLEEFDNIPNGQVKLEEGVNDIGITCAYPMEDSIKERIKEAVAKCLQREGLTFNFKVDEAIVGGLILDFGGKTIDGSLHNRLRQALAKIEAQEDLQFRPQRFHQ
ncbi:MAG: F0F1 ATP synthase subunit delta [Candidatus Omnitrophota bacterium]